MDIMGTSESEGRMVRELPIIGWVLFGVSSIYGSVFRKMHRSWLTHLPIVSTAIRLAFFFLIPLMILDQLGFYVFSPYWLEMYAWFWCGLSEADAIHYVLDKDSSISNKKEVKKKYNSGRK